MKKYLVIGNPIESFFITQHYTIIGLKIIILKQFMKKKKLNEAEIRKFNFEIKEKKIDGINVTVPFKKKIIPHLDQLSQEAKKTNQLTLFT